VTATDEAELARQMEKAEQENAEVAGDDDEEDILGQVFSAGEDGEDGEDAENGENGEAGSGEED
jgi:translation initiation factor 2 subunit 1